MFFFTDYQVLNDGMGLFCGNIQGVIKYILGIVKCMKLENFLIIKITNFFYIKQAVPSKIRRQTLPNL